MTLTAALPATGIPAPINSIHFRPETHSFASQTLGVLGTVTILLAVCLVVVWVAKKKGWLDRWTTGAAGAANRDVALRIDSMLRLSGKTTVFAISDENGRYVVVESASGSELAVLPSVEVASAHE